MGRGRAARRVVPLPSRPVALGPVGAAVAAGATVQRITGLGFSLVCAPFLILDRGPLEGVRLVNVLALLTGATILVSVHPHVRWGDVLRLLGPALVVAPAAGWAARRTDADGLSVVIGVLILASVGALASGLRVRAVHGRAGAAVAGALSAAMNTTAGVGGPTVAMYAVNAGWDHDELRGTLAAYFLGLNLVSIASIGPPHHAVPALPVLGLVAVIGVVLGTVLAPRVPAARLRLVVLVVAAAGGLAAIAAGLT